MIKGLLLSNQIDMALSKIGQMIRDPYDQKEKENLIKLSTYIFHNRQGITNQIRLKDKGIERAGAIESNINKVTTSCFKKKGMSWSIAGAFALLKIKESILNKEWNEWWEKGHLMDQYRRYPNRRDNGDNRAGCVFAFSFQLLLDTFRLLYPRLFYLSWE